VLQKVDRILLRVPGLAASVKYYAETLGLTLLRQESTVASFRLGDAELVLHSDPDLPAEGVYYLVESVRAMYARRKELRLTFLSPPLRATKGWRATVKDPFGQVLMLLDRDDVAKPPVEGQGPEPIEQGKAADTLFAGVKPKVKAQPEVLTRLYEQIGRTADDLPYTPHFESLYKDYAAQLAARGAGDLPREEVWRHLLNLRKAGKLPKLGESRSAPPEISDADKKKLAELVGDQIGRRDRLPYTGRFDKIVDEFNKSQPRPISPHFVWRLVATLGKRSK
jgi:catechol 2,3-dioxygenase-like lactoylglutathione lyase family enzyme